MLLRTVSNSATIPMPHRISVSNLVQFASEFEDFIFTAAFQNMSRYHHNSGFNHTLHPATYFAYLPPLPLPPEIPTTFTRSLHNTKKSPWRLHCFQRVIKYLKAITIHQVMKMSPCKWFSSRHSFVTVMIQNKARSDLFVCLPTLTSHWTLCIQCGGRFSRLLWPYPKTRLLHGNKLEHKTLSACLSKTGKSTHL